MAGYLGVMLLVAHRPDLTVSGCVDLAAAGARLFELEVRVSHGRLVVSHFLQVLGRRGWLENDNWSFRWSSRSRDPTVADVVGLVPGGCEILLDLKENEPARRFDLNQKICAELVDRTRYRVSGGNSHDLDQLRAAGFRTWRSIGRRRDLDEVLAAAPGSDEAVSVRQILLDGRSIGLLHAVVPMVVAWTVNDVDRARELQAIGVDGVTTDSVNVMVALAGGSPGWRARTW